MITWDYICTDPLGEPHTLQREFREGGEWHRRTYKDKYYHISMLRDQYAPDELICKGRRA